eukprot:gb/GFBE01032148.1/.p1 GENE.gb/GFBE01032148.1/~~gb/GFBE01032148.1/.p1  ORF type:complete len:103 (+),score=18.67 gb/GFBE01032148.1/:1-309(+)
MLSDKVSMNRGETLCVQVNAKKTGELFRNMFYMRQVDLDDERYIIGLQARLPDDFEDNLGCRDVGMACFKGLSRNMDKVELVLAQHFFYSGSMRRRYNCAPF